MPEPDPLIANAMARAAEAMGMSAPWGAIAASRPLQTGEDWLGAMEELGRRCAARGHAASRYWAELDAAMRSLAPAGAPAQEPEPSGWRPRCAYCGEPFTARRPTARYCRPSHRTLAYQHRTGAR